MSAATIIKKKRINVVNGHHGGAWKVAYADFVTAMMAFFLLMWLLNATTEEQRRGIADYFDPSIPVTAVSGGGDGMLSGDSVLSDDTLAHDSDGDWRPIRDAQALRTALVEAVHRAGVSGADGRLRVTQTPEGMLVELVEGERKPLFETGSAAPSEELTKLLAAAAEVIVRAGTEVKITGHTDGYVFSDDSYTNWELSADRANTARRLLLGAGLPKTVITEVSGRADRVPLEDDPNAAVNRRIAIMLVGAGAAKPTEASIVPSVVDVVR
ncbi:flagellar motor protein MotB [Parvularcula oceani]|uniref:flagellar motor protein MotB n=1 Tax=Parvularcula oceani TaxID=1247963 RepID=UPI0009DFE059|nr:flagellar motor protein MotB [Parvularcula oceani]